MVAKYTVDITWIIVILKTKSFVNYYFIFIGLMLKLKSYHFEHFSFHYL